MAFTANTMFEVTVSNSVRNQTQNIPGKFGTYSSDTYTAADCDAGMLCTRAALMPNEGYEGFGEEYSNDNILNGNTWYMVAATNGAAGGAYGDHTGIYAFNNYDVNKAVDSQGNKWNLGANTLGIGLPGGEYGDFCEIIVGEQYTFGVGNFTAAPTMGTSLYATIANGKLTPSASAPAAGSGVYFKILRKKAMTEGVTYWGDGYVLEAARTLEAAAGGVGG